MNKAQWEGVRKVTRQELLFYDVQAQGHKGREKGGNVVRKDTKQYNAMQQLPLHSMQQRDIASYSRYVYSASGKISLESLQRETTFLSNPKQGKKSWNLSAWLPALIC